MRLRDWVVYFQRATLSQDPEKEAERLLLIGGFRVDGESEVERQRGGTQRGDVDAKTGSLLLRGLRLFLGRHPDRLIDQLAPIFAAVAVVLVEPDREGVAV